MTMEPLNIIPRPVLPPGQCIASLISEDPKGFIDTFLTPSLDGDHRIIVSVSWIEECARKLGWLDPDDAGGLRAEIDGLQGQVADLERELDEASKFEEAVHVLKRHGLNPQRKPGRPPKAKAA
jgi:hypothetical protein